MRKIQPFKTRQHDSLSSGSSRNNRHERGRLHLASLHECTRENVLVQQILISVRNFQFQPLKSVVDPGFATPILALLFWSCFPENCMQMKTNGLSPTPFPQLGSRQCKSSNELLLSIQKEQLYNRRTAVLMSQIKPLCLVLIFDDHLH